MTLSAGKERLSGGSIFGQRSIDNWNLFSFVSWNRKTLKHHLVLNATWLIRKLDSNECVAFHLNPDSSEHVCKNNLSLLEY